MKQGQLKIASSVDHDGDCIFDVTVSRGTLAMTLSFWGDSETWQDFGKQLIVFPLQRGASVIFGKVHSLNSDDSLQLEANCYGAAGESVLRMVIENQTELPDKFLLDFSIKAEIASINALGSALAHWNAKDGDEIVWEARIS